MKLSVNTQDLLMKTDEFCKSKQYQVQMYFVFCLKIYKYLYNGWFQSLF
jgi:hypothetical protein